MKLPPNRRFMLGAALLAVTVGTAATQALRFDQQPDVIELVNNTFVIAERFDQELKSISPGDRVKMSAALTALYQRYRSQAVEIDKLKTKYANQMTSRLQVRLTSTQSEMLGRIGLAYNQKFDTEQEFLDFNSARFRQMADLLEKEAQLVRKKGESDLSSMQSALRISGDVKLVGMIWKDLIG